MQAVFSLFAENIWPLLWLLALAELILVLVLIGTGRRRLLVAIAILPLVALMLLGLEWLLVTDRERVHGILGEMARAVEREDAEGILRHLAPHCRYGSLDRTEIERLAQNVFHSFEVDRLKLTGHEIQLSSVRQEARAEFVSTAWLREGKVAFHPYRSRWVFTFGRQQGGVWQVVDIEQKQIIGDRDRSLPVPNPSQFRRFRPSVPRRIGLGGSFPAGLLQCGYSRITSSCFSASYAYFW